MRLKIGFNAGKNFFTQPQIPSEDLEFGKKKGIPGRQNPNPTEYKKIKREKQLREKSFFKVCF